MHDDFALDQIVDSTHTREQCTGGCWFLLSYVLNLLLTSKFLVSTHIAELKTKTKNGDQLQCAFLCATVYLI